MTTLPVLSSVLSPRAIGGIVASAWGLDLYSCQLLHHREMGNDHYLLEHAGGTHVFRLYAVARGTAAEITYELELARHVAAAGVGVSVPVPTIEGDWSVAIGAPEGSRVGVLWTEAVGEPIEDGDSAIYGVALARFHSAADSFATSAPGRPLDAEYLVRSRVSGIVKMLEPHRGAGDWFVGHAERVLGRLDGVGATAVDIGPCHGDAHAGNAVILDKTITFFDMEFAGPGPRVNDLATCRRWPMLVGRSGSSWPQFLDGYESVRPLAAADRDLIDLYVAATNIWVLGVWAGADSSEPVARLIPTSWIELGLEVCRNFDPA